MSTPARTRPLRLLAAALLLARASPLPASPAGDCLACHSDPTLTMERKGRTFSLAVDPSTLARSSHRGLDCLDCHAGFDPAQLPHRKKIEPVNCLECHSGSPERHPFHPRMGGASGKNGGTGLSCKGCHGTHEVISPKDAASPFHPSRLAESCGKCHRAVAEQFAESEHGNALAAGVKGAPTCLVCHDQRLTRETREGNAASLKIAQERMCLSCHLDDPDVRQRMAPGAGFIAAYEKSVHGKALLSGNAAAANCVDCHGSHEMKHGFDPKARVSKEQIPRTCSRCHAEIAARYDQSVHAAALKRGNGSAPVCTDCHGEHNILLHTDPRSPVAARNVSAQVCSPCHSSLKLSEKYGIASDRFRTFADSYHGLALRGGSVQVANCASCHGAHDIKASSDPTSPINKTNLAATCGRCHPGANERFTIGPVHVLTGEPKEPLLYWIASLYVGLIVVTVGGMLLHNLLDFVMRSHRRLKIRRGEIPAEETGRVLYLRMTVGERIQHGALMSSFTVLVVTGFMLRYPDAPWVRAIRSLSDHAFDLRSLAHRTAAVVMVAAGFAHIIYLAFTSRGRQFLRDIYPNRRDVTDAAGAMAYNLGLSRRKPRFGRFSYVEKSEYWAVVWGTIVMALTGTVMWFENFFIGQLTKLGWDVARTVHFYEAWLATLAILVWHFYSVIFNPDVYPMNPAWLTGELTEAEMAEEHSLELEAIRRRRAEAEEVKSPPSGGD